MKTSALVKNKSELLTLLNVNKDSIQKFGVNRLGLFGSFVRDEVNEESDIDLLVELPKERKTMRNLSDLYDFLTSVTGRKIELLTPQSLSPYIGPKILKEVEYVFGSYFDFIRHIRDEATFILKYTQDKSKKEVFDDEVLIKALVNSIGNIGEATAKTSEEFRNKYPGIPWRAMKNTRNILVHHYFGIDYDALWNIISNDIPELFEQVNNILEK